MKKSLLETNPYLKDAAKRTIALTRNIETSSAIEGIWGKRDAKTGLCRMPGAAAPCRNRLRAV